MNNVCILIEKYCDLNPNLGSTSALSDVIGSANSSGIINADVLHYDEYLLNNGIPIDNFLLDRMITNTPEVLVVSYYPFENDHRNIKLDTLHKIRESGIPVIFLWFDLAHEHIKQLAIKLSYISSLSIVLDTYSRFTDKFLPMWSPRDESIFKIQEEKDIEVCFIGSTNGYGERVRYLNFLKDKVYVSGGQREHNLSIDKYAELFRRSKISLNFPTKQDESVIQTKGRVFESMLCGALLLERENEAIKNWFEPMVHYVPFNSELDLLNKISYYLDNEKEREEIVQNAYNKMKKDYSSTVWWNTILNKVKNEFN